MGPREFHEEISSTQDRATALAREGSEEGTLVVARRQSRGRGRGGRSWSSPEGGLYASIVLRTPPEPATWLALGIGAFLGRDLRDRYGVPVRVKWPNDLLAAPAGRRPRKLAGILVDVVPSPSLGQASVAGIGVNVRAPPDSFPEELLERAASLDEFVTPPPSLEEVERLVVDAALAARRGLFTPDGAASVRRSCEELLYGVGRSVTVDGVRFGRIATLGEDGALLVDEGEQRHVVRSGVVEVEGEA